MGTGPTKVDRNETNRASKKRQKQNRKSQDNQKMIEDEQQNTQQIAPETECTEERTKSKDESDKDSLSKLLECLSQHEQQIHNTLKTEASKIQSHNADDSPHQTEYLSKKINKSFEALEIVLTDLFKDVRGEIDNCRKHFDNSKDNVKRLKRTITEMGRKMKEKEQKIQKLKFEVEQYKPVNASATVQLFYVHEGNTINEIEKTIKTVLVQKLGAVEFLHCRSACDIDDKKLLIVPYIVVSRVGADAANAIKDIPNPGNTALLLVHNKEVHALPSQASSGLLTDQKFKNLRGIFDIAFTSTNGFYQCDMNSKGVRELCSFCKKYPGKDRL